MRTLSNSEATVIIGLLVERLGGEAILTAEQVRGAGDMELESIYEPATMQTRITARRKPAVLQGEIVTAEPQSIEALHQCEAWQKMQAPGHDGRLRYYCGACGKDSPEPPECQHPFERQYWTFEGNLNCGACGVTVGHDEDMRIRSINGGMNI